MCVRCSDGLSGVFVDNVEQTELTVESILSTALLEVFDTVLVEHVTAQHSRERYEKEGEQAA